jgi:GT2 family glycosyltransferase
MSISGNGRQSAARVSIVIITRNEGDELRTTVENVIQTVPASDREIIVADDGSEDGSTGFLDHCPEVRLVRTNGLGVARARNHGGSCATGDVIVFSDAHMRLPSNWHLPLLEALERPEVGAVAPGVYSTTEPTRRGFGLKLARPDLHPQWLPKSGTTPQPVAVLPGCLLAMRRETFLKTGGFDAGMRRLGGNDAEISCRLWLLGYEQLVVPAVEVGHLFRRAAPYEADWSSVVHNRLRMAFIHFGQTRIERVIHALRVYDAFPAALAMMSGGNDVFSRRAMLESTRQFDDDWFFERFQHSGEFMRT